MSEAGCGLNGQATRAACEWSKTGDRKKAVRNEQPLAATAGQQSRFSVLLVFVSKTLQTLDREQGEATSRLAFYGQRLGF